ncbi:hypothetical protein NDU88_006895 [Pleurodeles waltl]|uniref:Uncharacterized protein n=1 Tax=Pleurodeles waltl TaxID=8319 RepID=A0AAV7WC21_PLEWA|nr:hypothetical protein NDU88_006895 [Pleurodeles waltl]
MQAESSLKTLEATTWDNPAAQADLNKAPAMHTRLVEPLCCIDFRSYQAKIHAEGEKAGHLLAWSLRSIDSAAPIVRIRISRT